MKESESERPGRPNVWKFIVNKGKGKDLEAASNKGKDGIIVRS